MCSHKLFFASFFFFFFISSGTLYWSVKIFAETCLVHITGSLVHSRDERVEGKLQRKRCETKLRREVKEAGACWCSEPQKKPKQENWLLILAISQYDQKLQQLL